MTESSSKIVIVGPGADEVEVVGFILRRAGFRVSRAHDAATGWSLIEEEHPDLVLLYTGSPGDPVFDVLRRLRRSGNQLPVLVLSSTREEAQVVEALDSGADDYIGKPFNQRELTARARALIRRRAGAVRPPQGNSNGKPIDLPPLRLDPAKHMAFREGEPLDLTVTEFRLLHYLMGNAGSVVSFQAIMLKVWGFEDPAGLDMVRMALYRLRHKLDRDMTKASLLRSIPRVGVMLVDPRDT